MLGQLVHIVERRILLAVSVAASLIIISSFASDAYAMTCNQSRDNSYQMILDCTDTIDVKKSTMDDVYSDINQFTKSFGDAKVYNIRTEGSNTFATLEIPLPMVSDLKSDVKFSKSSKYLVEFLTGKLADSKLYISLSVIDGYDGTKNAGSLITFNFQVKKIPCYFMGFICASASDFEYALDKGLDLLEPIAKATQLKLDQTSSSQNNPKQSTQTETKEAGLRGPPVVDSDGDGISDGFDKCKFEKETYNGYLDSDGCPDKIPPINELHVIDSDEDGIIDSKDLCKFAKETYNGYLDYDGCPDKVPQATIPIAPTTVQAIKKELPSTFSIFRVERGEYTISKYSTTEVSLMGKIEGPGRGESIELTIKKPDGSVEKVYSLIASSGNFGNVIVLDGKSPPGLYSVVARNENKLSETISFQVTRFEDVSKESTFPIIISPKLPNWIKTNAAWWVDGYIDNRDFAKGIEYMIKQEIIQVHEIKTTVKPNLLIDEIPGWVKTNAKWWVQGHITDEEFRQTIEYLIKEGVIRI